MDSYIKNILIKEGVSVADKKVALSLLRDDIELAQKILNKEVFYCYQCGQFLPVKDFKVETETKENDIITNRICPLGHKFMLKKQSI